MQRKTRFAIRGVASNGTCRLTLSTARAAWAALRSLALIAMTGLAVPGSFSQTFTGTNLPGGFQDFDITVSSGATNLAIVVPGNTGEFSHLLLKRGGTPSQSDYDFIALANGHTNAIHLELPELSAGSYVVRVLTPAISAAHNFTASVAVNVPDLRLAARPVNKPLVTATHGVLTSNSWHYFRIDAPTNLPRWRIVLHSTNAVSPDLYIQQNRVPVSTNFWKRSLGQNPDTLSFTNNEVGTGAYFVGVFLPGTTNTVHYTLAMEFADILTLNWDPGITHAGTQVYTNQSTTGGDYVFKVIPQNTALGAWRTALNVSSGEASIYLAKGAVPNITNATYKSERAGSDGFVVPASAFNAGEDWFYLVRAEPNAQWTLVTGEPFVTELGEVKADDSSGSGELTIGAEGMRFFKTTVPGHSVAWRLWLNGLTNSILVKKAFVPVPGSTDLSQSGQMLVVPPYLVGGLLYFVGVSGSPGATIHLDSRQQAVDDIPYLASTNLTVAGYGYATFRVQVPVDQIAWQVSMVASNGNPNVAVRRNFVPNEFYNDAYSEVPGTVTDSVTLVPPTLSDGTFYITVYGTNGYAGTLQSGDPEITEINFVSTTVNTDTNRVGWRFFKVTDINQQLGALGWDLYVTNAAPGTRIALRRNAAPSRWNFRNPSGGSAGVHDFLSTGDFLQRPGHQADVWYVGVFNTNAALGNFTLSTGELTADMMDFNAGLTARVDVPPGKWQFFRVDVPTNVIGWDVRLVDVTAGSPQLVIRREALPISLTGIGFTSTVTATNWPSGNQWVAGSDWTARNFSYDGSVNESGRVLTMGYGRPLETGTYYIGVISPANSTNAMSYTVQSRGIGPGQAIPVTDIAFAGGAATNDNLAARDVALYRVVIPPNTPSWKVKLTPASGDAVLAVARDRMPNITAGLSTSATNTLTAGRKMLKAGNEHFVLLPPWGDYVLPGTYYLLVASDGLVDPGNTTRIGLGSAGFVLQSVGTMPRIDLGMLESDDIVYSGQLEGGESIAFHFHNLPETLGFELSLEDRVGNPVMVSTPLLELVNPGASGGGVGADPYGNEGGWSSSLPTSPSFITVADPYSDETVMMKARASGGIYPDASYTLRIRKLVPAPLSFDGGIAHVPAHTNIYEFFKIEVPSDALGWDVRIAEVFEGAPHMLISRDSLPVNVASSSFPGTSSVWPSGARWLAAKDWTQRSLSADGADNEDGRIIAMGMGRPLEPGTYYVAVRNPSAPSPVSYTLSSRGIGPEFTLPVVDLPFSGGIASRTDLEPREAAYYRVVVPTNASSWQVKLNVEDGEALLLALTNSVPSVLTGRSSAPGKAMQKSGSEHYVFLPLNTQTALPPGTNFLAVVSEGAATNAARIGSGPVSYVLESRGELDVVDLGTVGTVDLSHEGTLEGGEVRAYQFSVPAGTTSLEAQLLNPTGNPAMVLRAGAAFPNPGAASSIAGAGSVSADAYGNEGGYTIAAAIGNANTNLITVANPSNGVYTVMVKARGISGAYTNASYTLVIRATSYTPVEFDGGIATVTNQPAGTWSFFRIHVPTNALGWDVRLINVTSGLPRLVVRRELLPAALSTTPWSNPSVATNWPPTNSWAAGADWTRRTSSADNSVNEDGRILAMGMGQPLEPGIYYIGVINSSGTAAMSYSLQSRGVGEGFSIPVVDLPYNGGSVTHSDLPPREAAYYRVVVPTNTPGWKVRLAPTAGEAMLLVLKDRLPNVDSGRVSSPLTGKFMQKAANEHYVIVPTASQTNGIPAGTYYLAVVGEGVNPASATRIGTGTSSFVLTSEGDVTVTDLGSIGGADLVSADSLEGGESRFYRFIIPPGMPAVEMRLENRVGNPVMVLLTNSLLPDPGGVLTGQRDAYGNDGGITPHALNANILTVANPVPGVYTIAVKARVNSGVYPDANYTLRVRQIPAPELNFSSAFNTNGLSNAASGLLLDNQRVYYKVVVPEDVHGAPVLGWQLDLSQLSGFATLRVRKDALPSDTVTGGMPFAANAAIIAPPFLTNGTWYVEVRGSNSTAFTLVSSEVTLQRPAWTLPAPGDAVSTPGLTLPDFADTGLDTNGVALPGDQGIDLQQGRYHFYAVSVPTNNGGLLRVQLDAISGNSDVYLRMNQVPTYSHRTNGTSGTIVDRTVIDTVTQYANWVPLNGKAETNLTAGMWCLAVRAFTNANARYRLRLSTGNVQELPFAGGSASNQVVAGGDWRYYRVQVPDEPPEQWHVTFSQQSGDVVMHVRDTAPPGNGATIAAAEYKDWASDKKTGGDYTSYTLPGTYTFGVPPLRPGTTYYLGFRGKSDSSFSVSTTVSGVTNPPPPEIAFYGGAVTNTLPAHSQVAFRILTPDDGLRWRHNTTHSNVVQLYLENGTMPSKVSSDAWRSTSANSTADKFLTAYPWLPNQTFYLVVTNTSALPQTFSFRMNGSSITADDDNDGMPDAWELAYFGSLSHTANGDADGDGVSNLNEYLEGTDPTDKNSLRPRLVVLAANGVVAVDPLETNYTYGTSVTLAASPNAGYHFTGWTGGATGLANPLTVIMNSNRTITAKFRVPGDDFEQRIPLAGMFVTHSGLKNVGATKESGEPNHASNGGGKSLWWTWTAPVSATIVVTTEGTDFRNMLAVYTGSSVSTLTAVASHLAGVGTNTSRVTFNSIAGVTYHIAVDGHNGASGNVVLNLALPGVLILDAPARLQNGSFAFAISGQAGQVIRIEATTHLAQAASWEPIATLTNTTGTVEFVDSDAGQFPSRYYRAVDANEGGP